MNETSDVQSFGTPRSFEEYDFMIIGQGLCGTLLSWYMLKAGKKVVVIDHSKPFTASKVASGVINPVTGRRIVRTWRIEELLPFAWNAYEQLGKELKINLVSQANILDFFPSVQMKEAFEKRLTEEEYLALPVNTVVWKDYFSWYFGIGEISPCLLVNVASMLEKWRMILAREGNLVEEEFTWADCIIDGHGVAYKNLRATKVICCEGAAAFDNPWFRNLPWSGMKGEALIVSIPDLPRSNIYKQGLSIVPWKDDLFWIGSTYEWDFKDLQPTPAWRTKVEEQLKYWLKIPFTVVDHLASGRPANMERRPFVGLHPRHPAVAIFNGMGAKGCSLAPFFAHQLTHHLISGAPIYPDADVQRFSKVLDRQMR